MSLCAGIDRTIRGLRNDRAGGYGTVLVTLALALVLGAYVAFFDANSVALLIAATVYGVLVVASFLSGSVAISGVLGLVIVPLLNVGPFVRPLSVDVRVWTLPILAGLFWCTRRPAHCLPPVKGSDTDDRLDRRLRRMALPVFAGYCALTTIWAIDPKQTFAGAVALTFVALACHRSRRLDLHRIAGIIAVIGAVLVVASFVVYFAVPGYAVYNGRFRGIFQNANSLAILLVLWLPIAVSRLPRLRWICIVAALSACLFAASRAGMAALLLETGLLLTIGRSARTRTLVITSAAVIGWWVIFNATASTTFLSFNLALVRSNNSREQSWSRGIQYFEANPIGGVGALPNESVNGIVQQMLATGGAVGLVAALAFVVALLCGLTGGGPLYGAIVVGGLANLLFEPWLFAGGSAFCVLFWMVAAHPRAPEYGTHRKPTNDHWTGETIDHPPHAPRQLRNFSTIAGRPGCDVLPG